MQESDFLIISKLDGPLSVDSDALFIASVYVVFGLQVLSTLFYVLAVLSIRFRKKRSSTIMSYIIKMLSVYSILLTTVLFIPYQSVIHNVFQCSKGDGRHGASTECYSGVYYVHVVCSAISALFLYIQVFILGFLYYDLSPYSTVPWAAPASKMGFFKIIIKMGLPIYFTYDVEVTLSVQSSSHLITLS